MHDSVHTTERSDNMNTTISNYRDFSCIQRILEVIYA